MADLLSIALFENVSSRTPRRKRLAWEQLREHLTAFDERPEKDGPLWSPVRYRPGVTRGNAGVAEVEALVLDFDDGTPPGVLAPRWEPWEYAVHSSFSSTPEHPKWRAVFPLAAAVPGAEWPAVYRKLALALSQGHADPSCKDQARMYFLPSHPPGNAGFAFHHAGARLDHHDFPEPEPERIIIPIRPAAPRENGRVKSDVLLARALEHLGEGRNNRCLWLACQLRDNEYSEGEAKAVIQDYVRHVPATNGKGDRFTEAEALETLRKAYARPAREPWERLRDLHHEPPPETEEEPAEVEEGLPEGLPDGEEAPELDASLAQDLEDAPTDKAPSDLTLARRWAREVKQQYCFFEGAQWWEYSRGRWVYSSTEHVEAEVQRYLERLRFNGVDIAITAQKVANVLKLARAHLGVHKVAELNACPTLIPLRNGVFDAETGRLLPHDPKYFLTNQLPFDYDPTADCPRWKRFLDETMLTTAGAVCEEWIRALQEWFGYCLGPDNAAQVSMVWVGEGRNGKGVAARTLEALLGPQQCCAVPVEQLHDPYHRAELQGKLVGFVNEPDPRAMLKNGAYFKAITGGDTISARRPTEKVFSFVPFCRLVISTNSIPGTKDLSHGYFRRLLIIEWRRNFSAEDADPHLDAALRRELAGIFNWSMEGLRWFRERGSKFPELKESESLLTAYRLSEDPVALFLQEECEQRIDYGVWFSDLYESYRAWMQASGYRNPVTKNMLGRRLDRLGTADSLRRDGDRVGHWRAGIQMNPSSEVHPDRIAEAKEAGKTKLRFD